MKQKAEYQKLFEEYLVKYSYLLPNENETFGNIIETILQAEINDLKKEILSKPYEEHLEILLGFYEKMEVEKSIRNMFFLKKEELDLLEPEYQKRVLLETNQNSKIVSPIKL